MVKISSYKFTDVQINFAIFRSFLNSQTFDESNFSSNACNKFSDTIKHSQLSIHHFWPKIIY